MLLYNNVVHVLQDSSERLRPLQTKIDRLKEEKDGVVNDKDEKIEAAKAEVHSTALTPGLQIISCFTN